MFIEKWEKILSNVTDLTDKYLEEELKSIVMPTAREGLILYTLDQNHKYTKLEFMDYVAYRNDKYDSILTKKWKIFMTRVFGNNYTDSENRRPLDINHLI